MIATRTAQMPRYRFTIRDHDSFDDEDGVILPDDLAARTHAIGIIQELREANEADWSAYTMEVIRDGRVCGKFHLRWPQPMQLHAEHLLDAPGLCQHHQRSTQTTVAHDSGWGEWTRESSSLLRSLCSPQLCAAWPPTYNMWSEQGCLQDCQLQSCCSLSYSGGLSDVF